VRARERRAAAGAAVGWDPLVRVRCAATSGGGAEGAREIQRAMPDRRPGCSLVVVERGEADSTQGDRSKRKDSLKGDTLFNPVYLNLESYVTDQVLRMRSF